MCVCVCGGREVIPLRWRHSVDEASTAANQRTRLSTGHGFACGIDSWPEFGRRVEERGRGGVGREGGGEEDSGGR